MIILDRFLNKLTMYRLVLYYLLFLIVVAEVLGFFKILNIDPLMLLVSVLFLSLVCFATNYFFSKTHETVVNHESWLISALILALIITPPDHFHIHSFPFLFWAGIWTIASKYIVNINRKHLFNPVAFGVFLPSLFGVGSASWWIGTLPMLPAILLGGLIIRKLRRFDLFFYFFLVSVFTVLSFAILNGNDVLASIQKILFYSALLFFGFVMLTEPLTTPPSKFYQSIYGGLVGFLLSPQIHIGNLFTTPETALLLGNIFSYLISPKFRLVLTLKQKISLSPTISEFIFDAPKRFSFLPGQYLEWTIQNKIDSRGNRRYFTISSSPTEKDIKMGIKFNPRSSKFKDSLISMEIGEKIIAGSLSGDFVLPKDVDKRLVFVAGGIGVTPFRSMIKYLIDENKRRDIVLIYSVKDPKDFVYLDILEMAQKNGVKLILSISDSSQVPANWHGYVGYINEELIQKEIPDFSKRSFYISGPSSMIDSFAALLKKLEVSQERIKKDYFPGF